jgi:hypothetical protein
MKIEPRLIAALRTFIESGSANGNESMRRYCLAFVDRLYPGLLNDAQLGQKCAALDAPDFIKARLAYIVSRGEESPSRQELAAFHDGFKAAKR